MTLLYLSLAWLAGIVCAKYENGAVGGAMGIASYVLYLCALSVPLVGALLWYDDERKRRVAWLAMFALLGALRYTTHLPNYQSPQFIGAHLNREVTLAGVITRTPEDRDKQTILYVKPRRVSVAPQEGQELRRGLVRVQTSLYRGYQYGDVVQIAGKLEEPPEFEDFSYRDYLARRDVYALMRRPQLTLTDETVSKLLLAALTQLRAKLNRIVTQTLRDLPTALLSGILREQASAILTDLQDIFDLLYVLLLIPLARLRVVLDGVIARILPEPHAALLSGILLGLESKIPADLWETFNVTGISHIIVISGYNFVIIIGVIIAITRRWLYPQNAAIVALVIIWLYALLVGAAPPVIRAAMVASLLLIAWRYGRLTEAYTSLGFAALLMSLHNPLVLWDVSFQLTFAATLSLIQFAAPAQERLEWWLFARLQRVGIMYDKNSTLGRIFATFTEAFIVTLAAQVVTLPVLLYHFGTLSPYFPLTNTLVLPVQPFVMLFGSVVAIVGLFSSTLGQIIAAGAWLPLAYTIAVAEFVAKLPYSAVSMGRVPPWAVIAYYITLTGAMLWGKSDSAARAEWRERLTAHLPTKIAVTALSIGVLLVWIAVRQQPDGKLHLFFLDVSQGDAILIVGPQGQQILVDGGPSPSKLLSELGKRVPFWDRTLDLVVLTHPDDDHVSGLVPVLERYRVKQVLDTTMPRETVPARRWDELLRQKNIPVTIAHRGMMIALGSGTFADILNPSAMLMTGTHSDDNNNSITLRVRYGRAAFLLTGDVEEEAERAMLHSGQYLLSLVLKVGHHGSKFSTSAALVEAVRPALAVIQVGADNRFGHPAPEVLDNLQGINVLWTDEQGTIEVITDGYRYEVRTTR